RSRIGGADRAPARDRLARARRDACARHRRARPIEWRARRRSRAEREGRRRLSRRGRNRPPLRPTRFAPMSGFLRGDSLYPCVVPALGTHTMWALGALAAGATLDDDRGRLLVRVAGALSPLRGTSLGDGHGSVLVVEDDRGVRTARCARSAAYPNGRRWP